MAKTIRIKLAKSTIGFNKRQKATAKALGLRKLNQVVEKEDTPDIRGMVTTIAHLVEVTEKTS
jgi:large subunit ribosomal protein L30